MKKGYCFLILLMFFFLCGAGAVQASQEQTENQEEREEVYSELFDLYDFADIDKEVKKQIGDYSFSEMVGAFMQGDFGAGADMVKNTVISRFFREILYNKYALIKIIVLAVISAMFSNLSVILDKTEISETGFFITYILMITILIGAFDVMSDMMLEVTEDITAFVKVIIPALVLSVGLCCGQATALGFGEIALFIIYIGEAVIKSIILPFIKLYVILMSVNHLMSEDYLSRFGNLFKGFVLWFLKFFTAAVMGINIIKGMILPGIDMAGKNAAVKLVNLIPGAETVTSAGSVFLSSAAVIKNAVGGAAVLILLLIILVPAVKMLAFVAAYKLTAALIQPIADKRLSGCVDCAADGVMLLNKLLMTQFIMLSLSVAVVCMVTA